MPTKVTMELVLDDKVFYISGKNKNIEPYIDDFQKVAKLFHILKNVK